MAAPKFPISYTATGVAVTVFALGFPVLAAAHVRVTLDGVLKTLGTDYAIQDVTSKGPTVRFMAAPAEGVVIKFYRNTPIALYAPNPAISNIEAVQAFYRSEEASDQRILLQGTYGQTALLAGTALSFVAPCDGYIEKLSTRNAAAVTTGGAITVEVAGVAVVGLTVTIGNSAAAGAVLSDVPTVAQSATTKVRKGQVITVTPAAAFDTAGDITATLELQPADL